MEHCWLYLKLETSNRVCMCVCLCVCVCVYVCVFVCMCVLLFWGHLHMKTYAVLWFGGNIMVEF